MKLNSKYFLLLFGLFVGIIACDDDKNDFSVTPAIGFGTTVGRVSENIAEGIAVPFYSNVKLTEPVTITMSLRDDDSTAYGTDYTVLPEPVDGKITVTIQPDEDPAFMVYPVALENSPQVRKINFEITSVSGTDVPLTDTYSRYYELWITKEVRLVDHNFEDCNGGPVGFTEKTTLTDADSAITMWACSNFGYAPGGPPNYSISAIANAYGRAAKKASNSYLISDVIEAGEYKTLQIAMKIESYHTGAGSFSVVYSENYSGRGNPEATGVTWTQLPNLVDEDGDPALIDEALPKAGSKDWRSLVGLLSNATGKHYYIAFKYTGGTSASASDWYVDDFIVTALK